MALGGIGINVETASLNYYMGHNTNHFISVYKYDGSNFGLIDSNVNSNRAFYGIHLVPVNQVGNALRAKGGEATITYANNFGDHYQRMLTRDIPA